VRKFDANYWRSIAIELNHRGAIPPEMESRWDAQGAFVAGARCFFENLEQIDQSAIDAKARELSHPVLRSMISRGQAFDACIEMAIWILGSLQPKNLTEPDADDECRTSRCGSECKSQPDGEIAHLAECLYSD
jgi:hypothetical protein